MADGAYDGPPAWSLGHVFTLWQWDPVVMLLAGTGLLGYLAGVRRIRRHGSPWTAGRTVAFSCGMLLWVFSTCSGLGVYEKVLFTDRAVQVVVLLMLVPLLLAMGAPVTVLVEALPQGPAERLRAVLRGRLARVLMFPAVSTALLIGPPWLFYFTPWYRLSLTSPGYDLLFHTGFVLLGLGYFWPRLQLDPVARRYHPLIGILVTVAEVIADAALGSVLVFGSHLLLPDYWAGLHRPWGMSPRDDQSWGGAVLWGLGDIAGVPFLVALILRVIREERLRTAEVDRELDEREALAALAPTDPEAGEERPWWETDPRLAHRYAPRR